MTEKRKETILPSGVKVVETRYDRDFTEIAVYKPTNVAKEPSLHVRELVAVISRQIAGGKWVVYTDKTSRAFLSPVKRLAIDFAVNYAEGN
jgi:hypothetical protein